MKAKIRSKRIYLRAIVIFSVALLFSFALESPALSVQPQVAAGYSHTVGLKSDGTVVAVGDNSYGQCNTYDWKFTIIVDPVDPVVNQMACPWIPLLLLDN
jgi:alpha-tubulin suppressor-like RCC1 family protein